MTALETASTSINRLRSILDDLAVAERLVHIREFVWRGGALSLQVDRPAIGRLGVFYGLHAEWAAPVLEPSRGLGPGLERTSTAVVEGRWVRGTAGYELKVGIELALSTAIAIRTDRLLSAVPFANRPRHDVEHALAADLEAYVEWFVGACDPVPVAMRAAADRLNRLRC